MEAAVEIELRHYRAFLAVVENGSLGEAAKRLDVSQPTLTHIIQALERAVGGVLFNRSSQGMEPNALGRALEARARVIAGEVGRAQREMGELLSAQRGKVVIGGGPVFAHPAVRRAVTRFLQAHPKVEIEIRDVLIREVIPAVKAGEIDYAIANFDDLDDEDVTREVLLPRQTISIVTGTDNPLARKRQISLAEIWPGPWLLPTRGRVYRIKLDKIFHAAGLPPVQAAIECNSVFLMKGYLLEGNLLAPWQELLIRDEIERNIVKPLPIAGLNWTADVGVIYRRDVPLPSAAAKLLDTIRRSCAEDVASSAARD
jgi:DNA-binding transcriptional LysR family regulator